MTTLLLPVTLQRPHGRTRRPCSVLVVRIRKIKVDEALTVGREEDFDCADDAGGDDFEALCSA